MIEKYIVPGERVELKAVKRTSVIRGEAAEKSYTTKIYDIISEDQIEILMPMEQSKIILLPVDGEYDLFFYTEYGLYECLGRIKDRYKTNNVYILLIELQTNLRKYQRREYYRYSCVLDMDVRVICDEEITTTSDQADTFRLVPGLPLKRSIIVDISGGGLRFVSDYQYEKGSYILVKYNLLVKGREKCYEIVSKILDVRKIESRNGGFEHRVQYVNLNNKDREEIIQFIFDEERKNRQREKGI